MRPQRDRVGLGRRHACGALAVNALLVAAPAGLAATCGNHPQLLHQAVHDGIFARIGDIDALAAGSRAGAGTGSALLFALLLFLESFAFLACELDIRVTALKRHVRFK